MPSGIDSSGGGIATNATALLSSMATRRLLADFAAQYEARTGETVAVTSIGGVDAARQVRSGAPIDVVVLAKPVMATLEAEGHLLPGSCVDLARSHTVLAVRAGASRPDLSSEQALKDALLAATSIGYSTGPSGDHLLGLLTRWGLMETLSPRLVKAPPGVPVAALLGRGEAQLGLQQFSELMDQPGVEIVGPLPPGTDATTIFTAGIANAAADPAIARRIIAFMTATERRERMRQHGMEPA